MKKLFVILMVLGLVLAFTGCEFNREVKADVFPDVVQKVEVYNGGAMIFTAENISIKMRKLSSSGVVGANEYFLLYEFYQGRNLVKSIMDSEALCITW
jgi:hypothetical protein